MRHSVTVLDRSGISPHNAVLRHFETTATPLSCVAVESSRKTVPMLGPAYTSRRAAVVVCVPRLAQVRDRATQRIPAARSPPQLGAQDLCANPVTENPPVNEYSPPTGPTVHWSTDLQD